MALRLWQSWLAAGLITPAPVGFFWRALERQIGRQRAPRFWWKGAHHGREMNLRPRTSINQWPLLIAIRDAGSGGGVACPVWAGLVPVQEGYRPWEPAGLVGSFLLSLGSALRGKRFFFWVYPELAHPPGPSAQITALHWGAARFGVLLLILGSLS